MVYFYLSTIQLLGGIWMIIKYFNKQAGLRHVRRRGEALFLILSSWHWRTGASLPVKTWPAWPDSRLKENGVASWITCCWLIPSIFTEWKGALTKVSSKILFSFLHHASDHPLVNPSADLPFLGESGHCTVREVTFEVSPPPYNRPIKSSV